MKKLFNLIPYLLFFCFTLHAQHSEDTPVLDRVSTLELSQPLHSRSQLGGLTVDRLGYIYVANFADAVWRISPDGEVRLLTDGLYGSSGNTIDAQGNLYQANFFAHNIIRIDRFGEVSTFTEEGLNGPVGMIFDDEGDLYVCNCQGNTVSRIDPQGKATTFAKDPGFNCPNGIAIDKEGNIFIANFGNDILHKITPDGEVTEFTTIPGPEGNAHLIYYQDNFYVTKIKNNAVYAVTPDGKYRLVTGGGVPDLKDGPAEEAHQSRPNGIGVDPVTGDLYVNNLNGEWNSNTNTQIEIRKIKLATLTEILTQKLDRQGIEQAAAAFRKYREDPMHTHENLGPALATLGWRYMSRRKIPEALALFTWQSEAYPDRWRPWYNLGEVYKIIGQNEKAIENYEKALKVAPENEQVRAKLESLR